MLIKKVMRYILILFVLCFSCNSKRNIQKPDNWYFVTKVIDGDTFWVENGIVKPFKVRLLGIDAPEKRRSKNKGTQFYANESKSFLKNLIYRKKIRLEKDIDSLDRYGRTLSYVYMENGASVNELLLENGCATVLTITPNVKFKNSFLKLQQHAKLNKKGVWKNNQE